MSVLSIDDLRVEIPTPNGVVTPVDGVSLEIAEGETLGLVGESGSGKSMTAMSILRMLPAGARITRGSIQLGDTRLDTLSERRLRDIRGGSVGTIFQEPMTALNPVFGVADQLTEPLRRHRGMKRRAAHARARELLDLVGIPDPDRVLASHPFQLSGGMRQRVMIAMALSCDPQLLIADEPTTALDVTTQAQILDLMVDLQQRLGAAVLLITHDLGVVAQTCERAAVMTEGAVVETATVEQLYDEPQHPYSRKLLSFRPPRLDAPLTRRESPEPSGSPLLEVVDLVKHFELGRGRRKRTIPAVDGVSFTVHRGRTTAIVGESGSGKSTTGRAVLRLVTPTSGTVRFDGTDVGAMTPEALRRWRSAAQIIFQDTYASLDPRWKVGASLAEPLRVHTQLTASERSAKIAETLELVGLQPEHADRFPHEFSGGQRQRVGIARALVLEPSLVVCDEPVSALDVSVQAQVLDLMGDLQRRLGLAYLFITHDLSVVAEIADDVIVMHNGTVVEQGPVAQLLHDPQEAYTKALIAAVPPSDPRTGWDSTRRREVLAAAGLDDAVEAPA